MSADSPKGVGVLCLTLKQKKSLDIGVCKTVSVLSLADSIDFGPRGGPYEI